MKQKSLGHVQLFATPWTVACQAPLPWDSPGKNTGVGYLSLLQGSFRPRDRTWVSCIAGRLLSEPPGKPTKFISNLLF